MSTQNITDPTGYPRPSFRGEAAKILLDTAGQLAPHLSWEDAVNDDRPVITQVLIDQYTRIVSARLWHNINASAFADLAATIHRAGAVRTGDLEDLLGVDNTEAARKEWADYYWEQAADHVRELLSYRTWPTVAADTAVDPGNVA